MIMRLGITQARLSRDASHQNPPALHFTILNLTPDAVLADYTSTQISDPPIEAVTAMTMMPAGGFALLGEACVGVIPNYRGGCARQFAVSRFRADGNLDTAFGSNGWSLTDVAKSDHNDPRSLAVQPDGKIIASGISLVPYYLLMTAYSFATIRYNADGSVDRSGKVEPNGLGMDSAVNTVAVDARGRHTQVELPRSRHRPTTNSLSSGTFDPPPATPARLRYELTQTAART